MRSLRVRLPRSRTARLRVLAMAATPEAAQAQPVRLVGVLLEPMRVAARPAPGALAHPWPIRDGGSR